VKWAAALLLPALALLAAVTFARESPPITTDADLAVGELYTELAAEARLLVGPYSRFGWHHPGPMYFYVQAPLYVLGGRRAAAMYAGALVMNVAAVLTLAWVLTRQARGPLPVFVIAACLVLALRAPRFLASPWTAHVTILPLLAFVALCAAMPGSPRLAPLLVVFGTFVLQTHVGLAAPAAALFIATAIVLLVDRRQANVRGLFPFAAAAGIGLLLWLPTMIEAAFHRGGNAAALARLFAAARQPDHTMTEALIAWSYGVTGVLRPDFGLPWGAHFSADHAWWTIPCAIGQLLALAIVARRDALAGRRFDARFAMSIAIASLAGLWSLTRVRDDILDHEIFWLSATGAITLGVIAAAGTRAIQATRSRAVSVHERALRAGVLLMLLATAAVGIRHLEDFTSFERRRVERTQIVDAYEAIRDYMRTRQVRAPLVRIEAPAWSQAAGILLRLRQDGSGAAVPDEWLPMFTNVFAADGREDAVITIGRGRAPRDAVDTRQATVLLFDSFWLHVEVMR
jgi:hypothetical protein